MYAPHMLGIFEPRRKNMNDTGEKALSWPDGPPQTDDEFIDNAINDVWRERVRQDEKWGTGRIHPNGTGPGRLKRRVDRAIIARNVCDASFAGGTGTWRHILDEEVCEAFAEEDPEALREELVQVAAVAVAWIESLDRQKVGGVE